MAGQNQFQAVAALGYSTLVPIIPPTAEISASSSLAARVGKPGKDPRGKAPGFRKHDGTWVSFDWVKHQTTAEDLIRWGDMGAGVGLRMGGNIVALDIDTMDRGTAETALRITCETIPGAHAVRIGRAPKLLILLRVPFGSHVPYRMIEFTRPGLDKPERIELLSTGKQAVVVGIHAVTGKPYEWQPAMPRLDDVIETTPEAIERVFAKLSAFLPNAAGVRVEGSSKDAPVQTTLRGEPHAIRRAMELLPNTTEHFPSRESYRDVGYALKAALSADPDLAFELFDAWSDRWDDPPDGIGNVDGYAAAVWKTLQPPFRLGASWLYEKLETCTGRAKALNYLDPIEPAFSLIDPPAPAVPVTALELVSFMDAARGALTHSTSPLVKGLLDCGASSVLYGPSGSGKTFTAMDIAMHVALGRPWNGKRVRQATAVYVAAEGGVGARKRALALRLQFGLADDAEVPFYFRLSNVDLFREGGDLLPLIAAIRAVPDAGLVVIDTLSRAMAGGDENASTDMGALVRNLDLIRRETSAHVMAVHHTGKDIAKGARGHSLLRAATDTELEVVDGTFKATKQREIETEFEIRFALNVVQLGIDQDGEAITSCTVRFETPERPAVDAVVREPTPTEALLLEAIGEVADTETGATAYTASNEKILECVRSKGHTMTYDTLKHLLKRLLEKNQIIRKGRGKWDLKGNRMVVPFAVLPVDIHVTSEQREHEREQDVFK